MLKALIVTMIFETLGPGNNVIHCKFPGGNNTQKPIAVSLDPRPSLKDTPQRFRVMMILNGSLQVRAAARPIQSTQSRDIIVRGISRRKSIYTIGLRDDGVAALNMKTKPASGGERVSSTRVGACRNFETHFDRWLS